MNNYQTIIGVEVHTELNTEHKIFSPAKNNINDKPNTNVHPIDLALPGTLPRFNEEVLKKAICVTKALNMSITKEMKWDRKNYFYYDNPKGFQITQQETPIGRNGKINLENGKEISISFMHMEEDTAKSFHIGDETLLDFNRCGVPLLEIVSGPDMNNSKEAREYLEKLKGILLYLDASDCKMEEGSLRVDVNISVMPYGQTELNPKVEIKNLNSFNNVELAILDEQKKQIEAYNTNQKIVQCTKRFNEDTKKVEMMRLKEGIIDYRYISEPDLPKIILTDEYIENILSKINKLPNEIKEMINSQITLTSKELNILMTDKDMTLFYLECLESGLDPKQMYNYLTVNINELKNKEQKEFKELKLIVSHFNDISNYLNSGSISSNHVKKILPIAAISGDKIEKIIKDLNIEQITNPDIIIGYVREVLEENPDSIELYKSGKDKAFGFMVGQIMKKSKGQANPQLVNELLSKELND